MQEVELATIRTRALAYNEAGKVWHFHILSPTCKFNTTDKYAFILEQPASKESLVYYSDQAEKELGQVLSPLLHRVKAEGEIETNTTSTLSETSQKIIKRAETLNKEGLDWHHHVLFPGCTFNTHSPKFVLILEDPETNELLESLSDQEPTGDLKYMEPLFYARKAG